jgi:hypothetical protein
VNDVEGKKVVSKEFLIVEEGSNAREKQDRQNGYQKDIQKDSKGLGRKSKFRVEEEEGNDWKT